MVDSVGMEHGIRLSTVNINAPDPSALGAFYARLLGWEVVHDDGDWVVIGHGDDYFRVTFELDAHYQRPVWPTEPGKPPIQMHLDIRVTDLEGAVEHAQRVRCGAGGVPAPGRRPRLPRPRRPRLLPVAGRVRDVSTDSSTCPSSTSTAPRSRRRPRSSGARCGRTSTACSPPTTAPVHPAAGRAPAGRLRGEPRRCRAERLVLTGRHRFSRYALVFELEPLGEHTVLKALTYAVFPGLHGRVYRLLVIGSRAHVRRHQADARLGRGGRLSVRRCQPGVRSGARRSRAGRARTPAG